MKYRVAALGAVCYESAVIKAVPKSFRVAVLLKWGKKDSLKTIENLAKAGFAGLDIGLAPFDYSHKYPLLLVSSVLKDAKRVEVLALKYPSVEFRICPFWEHNHKRSDIESVFQKLIAAAPHCKMLNVIWKGSETSLAATEIHLPDSKPRKKPLLPGYTVCTDGFGGDGKGNIADADCQAIFARYSDAECHSIWSFGMNGKFGHKDPREIDKRDDYASAEYLSGHIRFLGPREGVAPGTVKGQLFKAFADDHDPQDWKDNKFLCIFSAKGNAEVIDSKGKVIDKLTRVLPDYKSNDDLNGCARYYSRKYAYQLAEIARKNTGSNMIRVRVGSKITKPADGRFRSGRFK